MKRFLIALCAVTALASVGINNAEAKRLGGGSSFGMSRNTAPMQRQYTAPPQQAAPTTAPQQATPTGAPQPAPQASGMRRWLGPIAGIAAGLGLAALFSHLGMGEGMGNILTIALLAMAAFFIFRMLFGRKQAATTPAYGYAGAGATAPARFEPAAALGGSAAAIENNVVPVPAGFDADGFVRQAKLNFIRLQAANDKGDLEDIKQFSTPEFFAEVKMQFDERGQGTQQTDIVQLDAALVEVNEEDKRYIASVRFHGLLREEDGNTKAASPAPFDEVWHLIKPVDGNRGWAVAGIQQIA